MWICINISLIMLIAENKSMKLERTFIQRLSEILEILLWLYMVASPVFLSCKYNVPNDSVIFENVQKKFFQHMLLCTFNCIGNGKLKMMSALMSKVAKLGSEQMQGGCSKILVFECRYFLIWFWRISNFLDQISPSVLK